MLSGVSSFDFIILFLLPFSISLIVCVNKYISWDKNLSTISLGSLAIVDFYIACRKQLWFIHSSKPLKIFFILLVYNPHNNSCHVNYTMCSTWWIHRRLYSINLSCQVSFKSLRVTFEPVSIAWVQTLCKSTKIMRIKKLSHWRSISRWDYLCAPFLRPSGLILYFILEVEEYGIPKLRKIVGRPKGISPRIGLRYFSS